ncbi:unnamed protein product [Rotaria sp. Silwood2]|nr:unnamed protein product [Rotaria sp. Silwood2]CAF2642666.1 unnamed protein product [Rotaria sp. Silwood2]CAF2919758.1 unnamed protein product [Rotaria sp. Silwood2]CAF3076583.1 unnamed protein product [Rotaria sp. Silwood2]CAF4136896.1 unnamed protein product [Rotaria sp. Silwood2]
MMTLIKIKKTDYVDLNFRNIPENDIIQILKEPFCGAIQSIAYANKLNEIQVYRKTVMDEIKNVIKNHEFSKNRTEKWISESFSKVLKYQNNGVPIEDRAGQRILQLTMDKHKYQEFRTNGVIPQFRSKGLRKSVYNFEDINGGACQSKASTIRTNVKRNIGINKNDIDKFNENIKSINVLNPSDPCVKNNFLRYLSENKVKLSMLAISIIFELNDLIVILMDDNGQTIDKLIVQFSQMVISHIGSYISGAIGSLLPGIGYFVIDILDSIICGFIGKGVRELIISLFPKVEPGEGPSISYYFLFIYGSNNCFGAPLNEYNLVTALGIPKSDYSIIIDHVAHRSPTNNDETKFIRMAFGALK